VTTLDISIIVPTRNRRGKIEKCLRAIADQTYPHDRFEVIVVDDGSDAPLSTTILPFCAHMQLRLVEQKNAGPARARNTGAKHAAGRLLVFTDDDCEPTSGWLSALYGQFQRWPDRAIGGETINALPQNAYSTASQLLVDYLYEYYGAGAATGADGAAAGPPFFTSNNLAVPATLFHDVGEFDGSFPLAGGEDREFCDRWQERGYRLLRAPDAIVRHSHRLSFGTFWRQHMNYGRGAFHLRKARAARRRDAIGLEPFTFYGRLLMYPARTAGHREPKLFLMTLMFVSQVANALGFVLEAGAHRSTDDAEA
jgi:glycosyltransferase involved in cell wall biosynthesis